MGLLLPPDAQGWPGGIHVCASAGSVTASVVGTGAGCDPSALKGGSEGFLRRRSVPCHMTSLDASFHWDPRSSSSTKTLAYPEAASENKGKAVN